MNNEALIKEARNWLAGEEELADAIVNLLEGRG